MIQKIKNWYGSLPNWAKHLVTVAEGAALGFLGQYLQGLVNGQPLCFSVQCFKGVAVGLLTAVFIAVRNYLKQSPLIPNGPIDPQAA